MVRMTKNSVLAFLLLLLLALLGVASSGDAPPPPKDEPLPTFEPSEKLPADGAVTFPVDI
jgi:hypothetical protein